MSGDLDAALALRLECGLKHGVANLSVLQQMSLKELNKPEFIDAQIQ